MKLYKYKKFGKYTDSIILNSSLYFTPPSKLNDPFDCQLTFREKYSKKEIRKYFKEVIKRDKRMTRTLQSFMEEFGENENFIEFSKQIMDTGIMKTGILSLSSNCSNILMWSHYSMNHEGLVFEFENLDKVFVCNPVDYKEDFSLLSYAEYGKKEGELAWKIFLTKYLDWKYEDEHRSVQFDFQFDFQFDSQREKPFPKESLTSILFGLNAKNEDICRMVNLCKNNGFEHIRFKKAERIPRKFALSFVELSSF